MFGLGAPEIAVIVLVVLVLFGAKKIPEIMRGMGQGIREFKTASQEAVDEVQKLTEGPSDESDDSDTPLAG